MSTLVVFLMLTGLWPAPSMQTPLATAPTAAPAASHGTKPLSHDAYDRWKAIQQPALSPNGVWLVYTLRPQAGDPELVVRNLNTGVERRYGRGDNAIVTRDSAFVIFRIVPSAAVMAQTRKGHKTRPELSQNGLGVMTLATGKVWTAERVKSFTMPVESSAVLAYLLEPVNEDAKPVPSAAAGSNEKPASSAEPANNGGASLIVRELQSGTETSIPAVTEYVWTKDGGWLAYATATMAATGTEHDGAYARRTADGAVRTVMTGRGHYKGLVFDEGGRQLAFLSDRDGAPAKPAPYRLYRWTADAPAAEEVVPGATTGLPPGLTISEYGPLEFSKDAARLFFSTAPAPAPTNAAGEAIAVDLWHWRDQTLQSVQKVNAAADRKRNYRAVLQVATRRVVQLATPLQPSLVLADEGGRYALGGGDTAYRLAASWEGSYNDYQLIDLADGSRRPIVEKLRFPATLSPTGAYALYFDQRDTAWHAIRASDGRRVNLTGAIHSAFAQEQWDTPDYPRPYGVAGWTEDDRSVLLYDRYDIWQVEPDGNNARMITNGLGRRQQIEFRYVGLDRQRRVIPTGVPLLLAARNDRTKASGFYRVALEESAEPVKLLMLDKAAGVPIKAKDADRVVVSFSRFDEFPDLWASNATFVDLRKVTDANPQQNEYRWGHAELMSYRNADGRVLQGIVFKPQDFDPAKTYPLILYVYERVSDELHLYVPPAPGTNINISRYVSQGYVVLEPDIVYDTGYPGESAVKCVVPAVQALVGQGFIDPARIGIQGHSWGGYEVTYLITHTNLFRAAEGGAAVSDLISAYGGIRSGTGLSRALQYERTQGRIGGPPWEKPLHFIANSPLFSVDKVKTPYLALHNEDDDLVPWSQSIEFFIALRRLGKEAYLFDYNGERHSLRERENQQHWTVHMAEFFDHYLKGAPRPEWMDHGVPYLERGMRDLTRFYGKSKTPNDGR